MNFDWPHLLWSLLLLPLLVLLYLWLLRKRRRSTVRLASLSVAKAALGKGPGWRRHVPPLLLLLAIGTLLVAVARPLAVIALPQAQRTIILAMSSSFSLAPPGSVSRYPPPPKGYWFPARKSPLPRRRIETDNPAAG